MSQATVTLTSVPSWEMPQIVLDVVNITSSRPAARNVQLMCACGQEVVGGQEETQVGRPQPLSVTITQWYMDIPHEINQKNVKIFSTPCGFNDILDTYWICCEIYLCNISDL